MPRSDCKICRHPKAREIEAALVSGASNASVSRKYGMGQDSVRRHIQNHLSPAMKAAQTKRARSRGRAAIDRLEDLYDRAEALLTKAEEAGQSKAALDAIKELRPMVELLAKFTGELTQAPSTQITVNQQNLLVSPEWLALQQQIISTLAPFPEARDAIVTSLSELEAS